MSGMDRTEYLKRVYAGVLGKIIGVYLGRPVEGWSHQRIVSRFGEISSFVNGETGDPLVVTDDDIGGTFTFIRALEDYGYDRAIHSRAIGQTWLNYLVEKRTILWWGGFGNSTEHTAYLRLLGGVPAPRSGSVALNGRTVANQIGAMIFIDGWALVSPGDPAQAARLAREAASVSHDDEAVHAAVIIAVMEAMAFVERDLPKLLGAALAFVPEGCAVARLTRELQEIHRTEPDWRKARAWLEGAHGYQHYAGVCHVIPNFGLIILALLYGDGDFRRSLAIVTTSGWDTDCNAGNVGCLLGIRNGLEAIEACPDLRRPHRDLMFLSSADGGRAITDAAREAVYLSNVHLRLQGEPAIQPKAGARYHFDLPGALHGFHPVEEQGLARSVRLENVADDGGSRALEVSFEAPLAPALVAVPVFVPPGTARQPTYDLLACPTLHPGLTVRARLQAENGNPGPVTVRLFATAHGPGDEVRRHFGPAEELEPARVADVSWPVETGADAPIFEVGLELVSETAETSRLRLSWMDWRGVPTCVFRRPQAGVHWANSWVKAVDEWGTQFPESFHLSQNRGSGLLVQGMREWQDYEVSARIASPLAARAGLAVRVQGLRRYYAVAVHRSGRLQLVKERDGRQILAEAEIPGGDRKDYALRVSVRGQTIRAFLDEVECIHVEDTDAPLESGAIGLFLEEGTLLCDEVHLRPLEAEPGSRSHQPVPVTAA
jgi:ADP-ribosylglycohydrolase